IRTLTPPKTRHESNLMVDKLSEIRMEIEDKIYGSRVKFPEISTQSIDSKYTCNRNVGAKTITYTFVTSGKKEVVKNEQ
ncbi:hypothetical protein CWM98_37250, partial [Klebsiella variicola]